MVTFNELPETAQKAYKVTNSLRTVTMFLSYVLAIVLICVLIYLGDNLLESITGSIFIGALIHGNVHFEFVYRKIWRKTTPRGISIIGLFVWILLCYTVFCFIVPITSVIFLIIDTVRFIQKKPLIYSFENKYFLESKKIQEELYYEYLQKQQASSARVNTLETLQKLQELFEQGVISEEEFNIKKAELLNQI